MSNTIFSLKQIKEILPQRYPLLMLDRAMKESETKYVAVKNLTVNENFFAGHFPGHPIMPGVLQVEAMKQLAQLAVAARIDPSGENDIYMHFLEKVKFRKPNNPGDRVKIEAEILEIKDGGAVASCTTSNNSGLTCQARITLAVRPRLEPEAMPEMYNEFDKTPEISHDVNAIMELIPHRYPFLLIDNIIQAENGRVVAIKNISQSESLFCQCRDDYMVLPGSILCEIIAQAGCVAVLSAPENKGKIGYFMCIDRAEMFHPVFPGDQLVCDLTIKPGPARFGKGAGTISVDGRKVLESSLTFAIVDA
ncbi:MAG: 3-hydroxyacyl-ACP dehydratase FabZ [Victivallaceae bacterium]|nr:3-hydroxyacyl-ACP dehydratase FabZ [Victivallaceae bacterium]